MKKNLKKVLAAGLAASMITGSSLTALAKTVEVDFDGDGAVDYEIEVRDDQDEEKLVELLKTGIVVPKTYKAESGIAPAEKFNFTFEPVSFKDPDGNTITYTPADGDTPANYSLDNKVEGFYTIRNGVVYREVDNKKITIKDIEDVSIEFDNPVADTETKTVVQTIDVDDYELGVYTYKVSEVPPTELETPEALVEGIEYSEEELYLVLTILKDTDDEKHYVAAMHYQNASGTDKSKGFTNIYEAGKLTVGKTITGNLADESKKFEFTVVFNAGEDSIIEDANDASEYGITCNLDADNYTKVVSDDKTTVTYTFDLTNGENVTFTNIPQTVTYEVYENPLNYKQIATLDSTNVTTKENKTMTDGSEKEVIVVENAVEAVENNAETFDNIMFTNTLTSEIDTGISLDALPYLMMLGMSGLGALGFISKKRKEEDMF